MMLVFSLACTLAAHENYFMQFPPGGGGGGGGGALGYLGGRIRSLSKLKNTP